MTYGAVAPLTDHDDRPKAQRVCQMAVHTPYDPYDGDKTHNALDEDRGQASDYRMHDARCRAHDPECTPFACIDGA